MEEPRATHGVGPMRSNSFSADLLQRLVSKNLRSAADDDDGEGIELSLGLSLNGRFGTDPRARNDGFSSLKRSSSISDFAAASHVAGHVGLGRSCSLPAETEEERRRRKELQSLRRLEAKRKRSEKQRNLCAAKAPRVEALVGSSDGGDRKDVVLTNQLSFQSSVGSHGSGSSGVTESDSLVSQGGGHKCTETRSPTSVHSPAESEQKLVAAGQAQATIARLRSGGFNALPTEPQSAHNRPAVAAKTGSREMARSVLEEMPSVSTTGVGPNGKRVEGFLYRYRKGEEVRIVCVCHGSFLSPAEFVKHAGGGDVAQPLKHIVVSPTSFL